MLKLQNKKILYVISGNEPSSIVRALVYKDELERKGIQTIFFRLNSTFFLNLILL